MTVSMTPAEGNPFAQAPAGEVAAEPVAGNPFAVSTDEAMPAVPPSPEVADAVMQEGRFGRLLKLFGKVGRVAASGAQEGWNPSDPIGMDPQTKADLKQWFVKVGMISNSEEGPQSVLDAFNRGIIYPAVAAFDLAVSTTDIGLRTLTAGYKAVANPLIELGLPRDIAALPEAFMGSPSAASFGRFQPKGSASAPGLSGLAKMEADTAARREAKFANGPTGIPSAEFVAWEEGLKADPQFANADTPAGRAIAAEAYIQRVGPPPAEVPPIAEVAHELGIIGPKLKPIYEGTPAEAAANGVRPMAANEGIPAVQSTSSAAVAVPGVEKAGNIRLDLIDAPERVLDVLRQTAEAHDGFPAAQRRGDISLTHLEAISEVTGMPMDELSVTPVGTRLSSESLVRAARQALIQSADEVSAAMKKAALTNADADLVAFQELDLRHSIIQEGVTGLTGDAGRTLNVFKELKGEMKNAEALGKFLSEHAGVTLDDVRRKVKFGATLDPRTQLPRYLHDKRKPTKAEWGWALWINGLISGPFSQAGYAVGNLAFTLYDTTLVTPTASVFGRGMSVLGRKDRNKVYLGETASQIYGLVAGVPDAAIAAYVAHKSGLRAILPHQIADNKNPVTQHKMLGEGKLARFVQEPSYISAAIDSFFQFINYRKEIEGQAYRQVAKEGYKPWEKEFWIKRHSYATYPLPEMLEAGVETANKMTFTNELGPAGKSVSMAINKYTALTPLRLLMPFQRIPFNTFKAGYENTPLAGLDNTMRANLKGTNGAIARDKAWARVGAGSAVMAWAVSKAIDGEITDAGPLDPKERAEWLLGHQPHSIKINGYWFDHRRLQPLTDLLTLGAALHRAGQYISEEEYGKVAAHAALAAGAWLENSNGLTGLGQFAQMMKDPNRYSERYIASFASTALPYSSFLGQTAAVMDPNMREVHSVLEGLKYKIPKARETLFPVRDWTGMPIANSREEWGAVIPFRAVNQDPIDGEMVRLDIRPTKVSKEINGIKLSPALYDEYQSTAGPLTRSMLESAILQPGWKDIPRFFQQKWVKNAIENSRAMAAEAMRMKYPHIIQRATQDKVRELEGRKAIKTPIDVTPTVVDTGANAQ